MSRLLEDGAYFATELEYLKGNLSKVNDDLTATKGSVDTFYFITVGALVFFMQAGFGMLEAGSVRTKNTRNILLKNLLDACIGALIWWAWGFAAAVSRPPPALHQLGQWAQPIARSPIDLRPPLPCPRHYLKAGPTLCAVRDGRRGQQVHRRHKECQGLLRQRLGGQ